MLSRRDERPSVPPVRRSKGHQLPRMVRVQQASELREILRDDCNAVVLHQSMDPELIIQARAYIRDNLGATLRMTIAAEPSALRAKLGHLPPALMDDIVEQVLQASTLTGQRQVELSLVCITSVMCPKFHSDNVGIRMLKTYIGPGTMVMSPGPLGLEQGQMGDDVAKVGELRPYRTAPGDLVFLKGHAWPGNDGRGAVHRSPQASLNNPRLVLRVDCLDD